MTEAEQARGAIEAARAQRERAAADGEAATAALIAAARRARAAGVSVSEIARLAGLTRDGLYKLLERRGVTLGDLPPR